MPVLSPATTARRLVKAALFGAVAALVLALAACSSPEQKVEKYTESGVEYLEKGDVGRANVQFQNALKINEGHVPALVGISQILEQRQDFQGMFAVLQRIIRLDPQNVDAHIKIGKLYLIGSDETAALESAEAALALAPENANAIALKGAVLLRLDDVAGGVALARRALEIDPKNTEAVAVIVAERARANDLEGALAAIEKSLAVDSSSSMLHIMRLQLLASLGRSDKLHAAHKELIALYPDNVLYRQMYAATLMSEQKLADARVQFEEIARLSPGRVEPVLDIVRVDYRNGGADAAKATFQRYIDADPDNVELRFNFGHFLRQEKDYKGAEAVYSSLTAPGGAQSRRARNEIAGIRIVEGKLDEVRKIVDEILAEEPRDTEALIKRASLKIEDNDIDSAVADLRSALEDKPDSSPAKLLMAAAFERKGDIDFATAQMAQAVADSNNEAVTSNQFARFLVRQKNQPRAEQVLLDSIKVNPRNLDNLKLLAAIRLSRQDWSGAEQAAQMIAAVEKDDPIVNRVFGAARSGLEDYAGAIEALSAENARRPLGARPLATLVSAYVQDDRADEAQAMLNGMIAADADNYTARIMLAQTLGAQKKSDEMELALKAALDAAPERPEAAEALYRYYTATRRLDDAETMLNRAAAAAPDSDALKVLRADLNLLRGRKDDALKIYEEILTRRPDDFLIANNYASLMLEMRDDAESRSRALQVARVLEGHESPYFADTLGWALYLNGDYPKAVAELERASAAAPDFAEISYHLGAAYMAAGDVAKGRTQLQKALSGANGAPFAQKARDLLAQN